LNGQHDAASVTRVSHRFLDEAGDTTFYGKGRVPIVGQPGVSLGFAIGMVKFNADSNEIRKAVRALQDEVTADKYLLGIASVAKKAAAGGFYFHATDDPPEVRERFFKFVESLACTCEVMVARKLPSMFALKHHHQEAEFYADVLSHLLKNKLKLGQKVVLNIAERGASTRNANLQLALTKAVERFEKSGVWTRFPRLWFLMSRITGRSHCSMLPIIFAGPCSASSKEARRATTISLAIRSGSLSISTTLPNTREALIITEGSGD
jgi:hypothetical protein